MFNIYHTIIKQKVQCARQKYFGFLRWAKEGIGCASMKSLDTLVRIKKNTPCGVLEFCLIVELRGLRSLAPFWITIQHLDHSVEITGLRFFELILFSLERTLYLSKGTICLSPSPINGHGFDSHIRTDNLSYFY